jgi:hypothetical protein
MQAIGMIETKGLVRNWLKSTVQRPRPHLRHEANWTDVVRKPIARQENQANGCRPCSESNRSRYSQREGETRICD